MKRLLTTLIVTSTLLITVPVVQAEDRQSHQGANPEKMFEHMVKRLDLSEEQQRSIKPIIFEEFKKMQALREARQEKIASLLTPKQLKKLEQMKQKNKRCKKED